MRLEYNPRALCYNLYCDTKEEHDKLKQMLEKPLTATDIKSIDNMIYADTDSIMIMKTKLNTLYGKAVMDMAKDYIVVHPNGSNEIGIIFKSKITGIMKHDEGTADILLESGAMFYLLDKYEDIVKRLL